MTVEPERRVRQEVRAALVKREGGFAFAVWSERSLWQERLVKMGWHPQGSGWFGRDVDAMPEIEPVFARFERCLPLMLLQSAGQVEPAWSIGLHAFAERMEGSGVLWWLYGSAALAVRGIDTVPGDVDVAVDDVGPATARMSSLLVLPPTHMRGWLADWTAWAFEGAIVEWLADYHPSGRTPPLEQEPAIIDHLEEVAWEGRTLLLPPLSTQLAVVESRGLGQRAAAIRRHVAAR